MAELTKEWLKQTIAEYEANRDELPFGLDTNSAIELQAFKLALASLEAEAVGEVVIGEYDDCGCHPDARVVCIAADGQADWENFKDGTRLYAAPPSLAAIDERAAFNTWNNDENLPIAGVGAKNAAWLAWQARAKLIAPPAPVSVPDEAIRSAVDEIMATYAGSADECRKLVRKHIEDACRASMLHGADGTLTNEGTIPVTQFKPVADLYGLTSPTGGETSFTFDAVEARDFIDGGWSCQEYVELERFQEAITNHTEDKLAMVGHSGDSNNMVEPVTTAYKLPANTPCKDAPEHIWLQTAGVWPENGEFSELTWCSDNQHPDDTLYVRADVVAGNSPVIPDGWVVVPVEPTEEMNKAGWTAMNEHDAINPTYRAMLAAAPQQEVTQALAKGMERYGDAMQKLADGGD